jgi:hypothetical protein
MSPHTTRAYPIIIRVYTKAFRRKAQHDRQPLRPEVAANR